MANSTRTKARKATASSTAPRSESSALRTARDAEHTARVLALGAPVTRGRGSTPGTRSAVRSAAAAPSGMNADVTDKLTAAAPAFGEVLKSLGYSVAMTQAALDDAAITSLKDLAQETVDVPVLIEQTVNDDGEPTTTNIVTQKVTLASIIPASMKQVESMTMRMDLMVSEFNATGGVKFTGTQATAGGRTDFRSFNASASASRVGVQAEFAQLSEFSTGSVSMAVEITERTGFEIPTPAQYGLGPQVSAAVVGVTQSPIAPPAGSTTSPGFNRVVSVAMQVRNTDGTVRPITAQDLAITVPPGITFPPPTSSTTVTYSFQRLVATAADPYIEREITVRYGQLTRVIKINL